jgi:hypothetical protein
MVSHSLLGGVGGAAILGQLAKGLKIGWQNEYFKLNGSFPAQYRF